MARCALNCREPSIARLAWEEILETASDARRRVEAHRQLAELDMREGCFDEAGRHLETLPKLAGKSLAASEASNCWLAYADYLANRLLVRKAREAVASACHFAEKSEDPAVISEAIGYAGLVAAMCGRRSEASDLVERALRIALDQDCLSRPLSHIVDGPTCASIAQTISVKPLRISRRSIIVGRPGKGPANSPA